MSDHALEMDEYEAANLLWLLRVARRIGLDTGDWLGQLTHKMTAMRLELEPNYPPAITEDLISRIQGSR